jgi:hypothetical protein
LRTLREREREVERERESEREKERERGGERKGAHFLSLLFSFAVHTLSFFWLYC